MTKHHKILLKLSCKNPRKTLADNSGLSPLDRRTGLFIGGHSKQVAQASPDAKITQGAITDDSVSSDEGKKRTAEQEKWNKRCIFIPD